MKLIHHYSLLGGMLFLATAAQAQLVLQPLTTFGTNGDGTVRVNQEPFLVYDTNAPATEDRSATMQRGMAYNPTTGHLLVANRYTVAAPSIHIVDATYGTNIGTLQGFASVFGGHAQFPINLVGVADDGAIYVCNLTTTPNPPQLYVYRWADEAAAGSQFVFLGVTPGNDVTAGVAGANLRWGDTMTVRGSGMGTEILISGQGNQFTILRPSAADLSSFTNITFTMPSIPNGSFAGALAFGPGNTFFARGAAASGFPTYLISYNYATATATVSNTWTTLQFPGRTGPIGVNLASNLIASIEMTAGTRPDVVRLHDISSLANPVLLDRKEISVWTNANNLFAGAVAWGTNGNIYTLNTENGLAALTPVTGTATLPVVIYQQPAGKVIQITSNYVFSVGADGTLPITYQWLFNSNVISSETGPTLTKTNLVISDDGYYSVIVSNEAGGAVTSSIVKLTVVPRFGDLVIYDPFDYPIGSLNGENGWAITSTAENGTVEAGNLSVPGLKSSVGNRYVLTGNTSIRKPFGEYSSGSMYLSFAFRLDTLTTGTANETFAGLSFGTSTSFPLKINMQTNTAGGYYIGVYKGGGTTANGQLYTGNSFAVGETVFIVGRLTFGPNAGGTDDYCDLWLNPDPSTFGAETAPTPTLAQMGLGFVPSASSDWTFVDRAFLRWSASGYPKRVYDEVRAGFSWAEVTPAAPPVLSITQSGSNVVLSWPENQTGFTLEARVELDDADGWQDVSEPVIVQGGNNTVTVSASGTTKFFRLTK